MTELPRPVFQRQGPAANCKISGKELGWESCTAYSMAMGIDAFTGGRHRPSGCKIREATGDTVGGLTLRQVADAAQSRYGIRVAVRSGGTTIAPEKAARLIRAGRGFRPPGQRRRTDRHALAVDRRSGQSRDLGPGGPGRHRRCPGPGARVRPGGGRPPRAGEGPAVVAVVAPARVRGGPSHGRRGGQASGSGSVLCRVSSASPSRGGCRATRGSGTRSRTAAAATGSAAARRATGASGTQRYPDGSIPDPCASRASAWSQGQRPAEDRLSIERPDRRSPRQGRPLHRLPTDDASGPAARGQLADLVW